MKIQKAFTMRSSAIGDCLMGKYLLEQIHTQYPNAGCSIIVASRVEMIRDLLAAYPWLVVREASRRNLFGLFEALRAVWNSDATVTQYSGRGQFSTLSKLFARLVTRRGRLVGFSDPWRWNVHLYDHLVPLDLKKSFLAHEQAALEALNIPISSSKLTLQYVPDPAVHERFNLPRGSYIFLHLFAGTGGRGFTREKRAAYVREMVAAFGDSYTIVLTGSATDRPLAEEAVRGTTARVLAGETRVQELANLIVGSAGVVSIDTGVAHMAAQLGVPLVVVRTCLAYNWWSKEQYDGLPTIISRDELCPNGHVSEKAKNCLNNIPVEEVIQAARTLIGSDLPSTRRSSTPHS